MTRLAATRLTGALLTSVLLAPMSVGAALIRVDPGGGGDVLTVAAAMAVATAGDSVAVIQGDHVVSSVQMVGGVELLGGWDPSFSSRTPGTSRLLSGTRALLCTMGQDPSTRIDGFEITGASNSAIHCSGIVSPAITNNEFHGNSGSDGAAVHCEYGASPLIEGNHIHHNDANYGGGLRAHWGSDTSPTIRGNLIEYNTAVSAGGGISVNNGSPIIEDNVVQYNTALGSASATGGGIHVWHAEGGVVEIRRNLIIHNEASEGGGIGITGGHPIIEYNTVWGNSAPEGGALYQEDSILPDPGTTQVSNNILGGSPVGNAAFCVENLQIDLACNCVYGNAGGTYFGCTGATDIYQEPLFCDAPLDVYTLQAHSPCAPPGPTGCGLIGAFNVGCGPVSIQASTWAKIKASYRD